MFNSNVLRRRFAIQTMTVFAFGGYLFFFLHRRCGRSRDLLNVVGELAHWNRTSDVLQLGNVAHFVLLVATLIRRGSLSSPATSTSLYVFPYHFCSSLRESRDCFATFLYRFCGYPHTTKNHIPTSAFPPLRLYRHVLIYQVIGHEDTFRHLLLNHLKCCQRAVYVRNCERDIFIGGTTNFLYTPYIPLIYW